MGKTKRRQEAHEAIRESRDPAGGVLGRLEGGVVGWFNWSGENFRREAKEWAQSIVIALLLVVVIRTFFFQAFKIPSGSMRPTLMEGDKLFVNKYVYRFHAPERGDIVVFRYPGDANNPHEPKEEQRKDYIKRLVALGGETVEIKNGKIFVSEKKLDDPLTFGKFTYYNFDPYGGPYEKIKVPEGFYYVLGDNSAHSRDSRYWGFVPKKNMIGKAVFRWWPPKKIGLLK